MLFYLIPVLSPAPPEKFKKMEAQKQFLLVVDQTKVAAEQKLTYQQFDDNDAAMQAAGEWAKIGIACTFYTRASFIEPGAPIITATA